MQTYEEWKKAEESDDDLGFRLGSLAPKSTGLPMVVWIEVKALGSDQTPRMRFTNTTGDSLLPYSWLPISVEKENPRILVKDYELNISDEDFELLKKWIIHNCDTLTDYWNGEIDTVECWENIKNQKLVKKRIGDKYGFVDAFGNWAIEPKYDNALGFEEDFAAVEVDGQWGYIRSDGSWLFEPQFDFTEWFCEGFAAVTINWKSGFVKTDGSWLTKCEFEDYHWFEDGLAWVRYQHKWGCINAEGKWHIEPRFDEVRVCKESPVTVRLGGKWGYIRTDGSWLIEPRFDNADPFWERYAKVKLGDKWGFIKQDGTWLIKPTFDIRPGDFNDGRARVEIVGKTIYIDHEGNQYDKK